MKNDLTKTLRKIIREEVEKAVRTEFVNFVSLMGEAKTSKKKVVKAKPKRKQVTESSIKKMVNDIVADKPLTEKPEQKLSNNPVLNKILNETQGGIDDGQNLPQQQVPTGQEEYPTMGGGTFDKSRMAEMLGYGGEVPQTQGMTTPDGAPVQAVPDDVSKAMTRNYGDLMKAIDDRKGGKPLKG